VYHNNIVLVFLRAATSPAFGKSCPSSRSAVYKFKSSSSPASFKSKSSPSPGRSAA